MSADRMIMCLDCFEEFSDEIKQDEIRGARRTCKMHTKPQPYKLCGGHNASDRQKEIRG